MKSMPPTPSNPNSIPSRLLWITTFGLGHMRPASGTWGSMPTVVLAAALIYFGRGPVEQPWIYHAVMLAWLLLWCAGCIVEGSSAEVKFGKKDPSQAVADETAGQVFPLLFLPSACFQTWQVAVLTLAGAFVAFRVFDILKIWPARGLQRLPAGWGILVDDLVAGVQALLIVQILARILLR